MKRFVGPMFAMAVLVIVVIILVGVVPSAVPHPGYGQGCSCMNNGIALYVDERSMMLMDFAYKTAESGESYSVLIRIEGLRAKATAPVVMTWSPDEYDNAKFMFDPQEIADNSPEDKDPVDGDMNVEFMVTAPEEPGEYRIALTLQVTAVEFIVRVEGAAPATTTAVTSVTTSRSATWYQTVTYETSGLSEEEEYWLTYLRELEKVARDVYSYHGDMWDSQFLKDLVESEQMHMDALVPLLENHGVADPVGGNGPGVFSNSDLQKLYDELTVQGSGSLFDALKVGELVEEKDITDLEDGIATSNHEDVTAVYGNLLRASEIHLNAFRFQLSQYAVTTTSASASATTSASETSSMESAGVFTSSTVMMVVVAVVAVVLVGALAFRGRKKKN